MLNGAHSKSQPKGKTTKKTPKGHVIKLPEILHMPAFTANFLSIYQITQNNSHHILFNKDGGYINYPTWVPPERSIIDNIRKTPAGYAVKLATEKQNLHHAFNTPRKGTLETFLRGRRSDKTTHTPCPHLLPLTREQTSELQPSLHMALEAQPHQPRHHEQNFQAAIQCTIYELSRMFHQLQETPPPPFPHITPALRGHNSQRHGRPIYQD